MKLKLFWNHQVFWYRFFMFSNTTMGDCVQLAKVDQNLYFFYLPIHQHSSYCINLYFGKSSPYWFYCLRYFKENMNGSECGWMLPFYYLRLLLYYHSDWERVIYSNPNDQFIKIYQFYNMYQIFCGDLNMHKVFNILQLPYIDLKVLSLEKLKQLLLYRCPLLEHFYNVYIVKIQWLVWRLYQSLETLVMANLTRWTTLSSTGMTYSVHLTNRIPVLWVYGRHSIQS